MFQFIFGIIVGVTFATFWKKIGCAIRDKIYELLDINEMEDK